MHSTPVAASGLGTASSGRSAGFAAAARQSDEIMGLPKGPEGQGLPEVRNPPPALTRPGFRKRAKPTGPAAIRAPRPLSQVCPPPGAPALSAGGRASVGVGGDKLQPVPGLPGRREPSQTDTCADAEPGPAGPGVPPLRLPPAVPRDPRRRSARLEDRGCCAQ